MSMPYSISYSTPLSTGASPFLEPGGPRERNVRQVFLRSYTFEVRKSYGERLKRRLRELNERGKVMFSEICDRISDGRFGVSVFRNLKSRLNPLSCFGVQKSYCLKDVDW